MQHRSGVYRGHMTQRSLGTQSARVLSLQDRQMGLTQFVVWTELAQPGPSRILLHLPTQKQVARQNASR